MPRIARPVFPGLPHHVTQRGNRRETVFFCDADHRTYLDWLHEYAVAHRTLVLAYCLMPNHMHAVVVPESADSLERMFRCLDTRYAMRVNRRTGWSGHVWQGRFFSAPLDDAYMRTAVRYVELNPVRAKMVKCAADYRWSSAAAHCRNEPDRLLADPSPWLEGVVPGAQWHSWLEAGEQPEQITILRRNVERAMPCGSETFVARLERIAGRSLRPAARGRPRKPPG
ncbi:MAG TPA: transposase [Verrucomicrobiae bacterium]|nr:transposase [Verrucomicrobiae bacterium]